MSAMPRMTNDGGDGTGTKVTPLNEITRAIARINREFAVILFGDGPMILWETVDPDGAPDVHFLSLAGFHAWLATDTVSINGHDVPVSKLWFKSPLRRQYQGIVFDPSRTTTPGYYNLWRGFGLEPAPAGSTASCARFLDHIYENVCQGNDHWFAWVMAFFADMVQRPTRKPGVALALRGTQGTGKTIIGETMRRLIGSRHHQLVSDAQRVVGRFNSHLAACLLLQLDEATWGGDHAAAGKLKDYITGEWLYIERKGKEPVRVRNHARLFVTGNSDWLIPAALEERRFAVFDMAETHRQDGEYFGAIVDELEAGGYEALLRYLLDFDLSTVNLRAIPETSALSEQKQRSLSREQAWWLDILHRGVLPGDAAGHGETNASVLYNNYVDSVKRLGEQRPLHQELFARVLRRMVPGVYLTRRSAQDRIDGPKRPYVYVFPPLAACREAFARVLDTEGWDADDRWHEDRP